MNAEDINTFSAMLEGTLSIYDKTVTDGSFALWVKVLGQHSLPVISAAFEAFLADPAFRGFSPKPSDIVGIIQTMDGRPGPEEAWASLPKDEDASACLTDEAAAAWGVAKPLIDAGNDVAARMTFKEVYTRMVKEAREAGTPTHWFMSLGEDRERRMVMIRQAASAGRISPEYAASMLGDTYSREPRLSGPSAVGTGVVKVLEHLAFNNRDNKVAKREMGRIRELLGMPEKGLDEGPPPRKFLHPVGDQETVAAAMEAMWSDHPTGKADRDVVEAQVDAELDMLLADDRANGEFPRGDIEFYRQYAEVEHQEKQRKKAAKHDQA